MQRSSHWKFLLGSLVLAALFGIVTNQFRQSPLGWIYHPQNEIPLPGHPMASSTENAAPVPKIGMEELKKALDDPRSVLLDARPAVFYEMGHVPNAKLLSRENFAADFAKLQKTLGDLEAPLIVYCSDPSCPDSRKVADALTRLGYRNVRVFEGGWEQWSAANP